MSTSSIDPLLRGLADKEEIRDLARRYADCVWRRAVEEAVSLFAEDGSMDTGMGGPPIRGRAALLDSYKGMLAIDLQPFVHNHVVDLDGDVATGRCYLDIRASAQGQSMIGSGFYQDAYVRTAEGWKFQSRKLTFRFFVPLQTGWAEPETKK
jgi:ketosteroid isomerase-like protein